MTSGEALKNEPKVAIPSEQFYKQPSSNQRISYTIVSLMNHDVELLDCGHYVSDFLISAQGFSGTLMMTISLKLVITPKGV